MNDADYDKWTGTRCQRAPDDWFPDSQNATDIRSLRQICACCPLQAECLTLAVAVYRDLPDMLHGIWGGLTGREIMTEVDKGRAGIPRLIMLSVRLATRPPDTGGSGYARRRRAIAHAQLTEKGAP